nr:adhesion G protein-coupled receptor E3 isoform X2 [Crassostrea gigas]
MMSLSGHSVYHLGVLTVLFCMLTLSQAYVNVAINKPAYQQDPWNSSDDRFDASNAVDGRKSDLLGGGGQCAESFNKQTATWWVNLTTIHSIHHITIYFRTDNKPWDSSNGFTRYFLGFSVYVSNTTDRLQGTLCYKDDNFTRATIPAVFTTTCPVHGQYAIYYNERRAGVTYPDDYSKDVFSDLCEVEVYGCPVTGYFGSNCCVSCPDVNCQYCHIETGTCQGCKPGYKGHRCEIGMAKRFGEANGESELPYIISCTNEALMNASSLLDGIIENVTQDKFSIPETVNNTLQLIKHLTSSTNKISAWDLNSSLGVLEKIVTVINATGSAIQKEVFYAVIDNILSPNNSNAWTTVSEKTEKGPSFLLKNMDRFSKITLKTDNITATEFIGSNFELIINQAKLDETGIRFPHENSNNVSQGSEKISTFLELPKQVSKATKAFNYVAVLYKTISDILGFDPNRKELTVNDMDKSKRKTHVNSQILSLTTQTDLGVLDPPLNLMFGHKKESPKKYAACVSWDFYLNKWLEDGCTVKQTNRQRTLCHCNHLTNFAILMRPYTPVTEDSPFLKTMSLVGVVLSIAFTFLTSLIYVLIWRFIKSDQNILKLNMCGSLILSYAMFISFVEQTSNEGACVAITAIIHCLFLVTFFSMLGLGVYYFMSVTVTYYALYVANNFKSKSRVCWFLGGIWGIPVIITVTNLGAFWKQGYHLKSYCWLSIESGSLYLFIIPVCLICLINILIIVSLLRVLFASSIMAKSSLQKKASSGLRSLGTLLPVLGVTWLFGILVVNEKAVLFQYLFVIANSLQVRHGIGNKYPSLSTIFSFAEQGTKETNLSLQSPSTSKSITPIMKPKKKSLLKRFRQTKTKESEL